MKNIYTTNHLRKLQIQRAFLKYLDRNITNTDKNYFTWYHDMGELVDYASYKAFKAYNKDSEIVYAYGKGKPWSGRLVIFNAD